MLTVNGSDFRILVHHYSVLPTAEAPTTTGPSPAAP